MHNYQSKGQLTTQIDELKKEISALKIERKALFFISSCGISYAVLQFSSLAAIILFVVSVLPFATKMFGLLYLLGAVILGLGFLYWAVVLLINKDPQAPMQAFRYSIIYLMALFIIMLADHYILPLDERLNRIPPPIEMQAIE